MRCDSDPASHTPTDFGAQRRAILAGLGGLAAGAAFATTARAGTLTPPGAPAGTMKRLDEVEPRIAINSSNTRGDIDSVYRITQPGSYYLTGNVTGQSGKHGIEVASDNVSIDLMGFAVQGVAGSLSGIAEDGPRGNVSVRNGVIRGWGADGVNFSGSGQPAAFGFLIEQIVAASNGDSGIRVGQCAVVRNCSAHGNGFFGISASAGSVIAHCAADANELSGISTSKNCNITHCTARENSGSGILSSSASVIAHCVSVGNAVDGFFGGAGSTIADCASSLNGGHGVRVSSGSLVRDNVCHANGAGGDAAGIRVTSGQNRIEGNSCTANPRGIRVESTGNFIVRNTASGNATNWDIAASNKVGAIVSAPNSGAILGATGGVGVGSTDPWANFSH